MVDFVFLLYEKLVPVTDDLRLCSVSLVCMSLFLS